MEYASRGTAGTGLGLAIAGTSLGLLNSGFLPGLFGGGINGGGCSENIPVNRYELSMQNEITNRDMEIAFLKGRDAAKSDNLELYKYVDGRMRNIEGQLSQQAVINAQTIGNINCMQGQIAQLYGLTKLVLPNTSVCPGWGDVNVSITPATTT